jgi:ABC-type glutathione transport system ATPase component
LYADLYSFAAAGCQWLVAFVSDLGVVASVADHVMVLHRGRVREQAATDELLHAPQDEYTKMLLETAPRLSHPEAEG